jgi:hypothetical protein
MVVPLFSPGRDCGPRRAPTAKDRSIRPNGYFWAAARPAPKRPGTRGTRSWWTRRPRTRVGGQRAAAVAWAEARARVRALYLTAALHPRRQRASTPRGQQVRRGAAAAAANPCSCSRPRRRARPPPSLWRRPSRTPRAGRARRQSSTIRSKPPPTRRVIPLYPYLQPSCFVWKWKRPIRQRSAIC